MWLQNGSLHRHESAFPGTGECGNCGNAVEFHLIWQKAGVGLGIPILMWFTDRFTITTHRKYYLGCPVCGELEQIPKDVALGFIEESRRE